MTVNFKLVFITISVAAAFCLQVDAQHFDFESAVNYLDEREQDWFSWNGSDRGDTKCIACHTNVTYAITRRQLGKTLSSDDLSVYKDSLLKNTKARVQNWSDVKLFYGGSRTEQSRGTESVLNALILANEDQQSGKQAITPTAKVAFEHLWANQITDGKNKGGWTWLDFGLQPWESEEGAIYGAALAAIAVGKAPGDYKNTPDIKENIELLRSYLLTRYEKQDDSGVKSMSPYHSTYVLWADRELGGLLSSDQKKSLLNELFQTQNEDGGWDLGGLGEWKRVDGSEQATQSDGYATGLVVYAALRSGMSRDDPNIKRAVTWIESNFDTPSGTWTGISVNKDRSSSSDRVRSFMTAAATSMSALALCEYGEAESN